MKRMLIAMSLVILGSFSAYAEGDHNPVETITGSGFDMKHLNDDIVMGTFNNIPIWSEKQCGSHIRGFYRINKETKEFSVGVVDKKLTGTFPAVTFQFAGIDKAKQNMMIDVNGQMVAVHYETDSFNAEEGHYNGLTFSFENNGKQYTVKVDGEACLGSMAYYAVFFYGITTIE